MAYTFKKPGTAAAAAPAPAPVAAAPAAHPLPPPVAAPAAALPAPMAASAAALPNAPAAPPAAAPAAAPVARRRAGRPPASAVNPPAAPAAQAPAAAPAPVAPAPAPVTTAVAASVQNAVAAAQPQRPGFLALLAPKAGQKTVGQRIAEKAVESFGAPNDFPTLTLKDGQAGGTYKLDAMNPEGSDVDLPTDSKPMTVVLVGYCHRMMIWNKQYRPGMVEAPRCHATIPNTEVDAGDLFMDAFKNCNFTKKENRYIFDGETADRGHVSGLIDLLVYHPVAGLIGIRSAHTYNSMARTTEEIVASFNDEPVPVCISIESDQIKTKSANDYASFYLRIEQRNDALAIEAWNSFQQFLAKTADDPELMNYINSWQKNSMTPEIIATLQAIKDIQ